uniref:Ig-like domain-containing protein n=1 Tax=Scophthalmus maximus TaxID=52904 RepID=A0A8D3DBG0_SCOMX
MNNFNLSTTVHRDTWISVSPSEFRTVEVRSGKEATLLCNNYTSFPGHIFWFRLGNGPNTSCISSMFSYDTNASICGGFLNGRFKMTSNVSTIFLQIMQVDVPDSGLYSCGFLTNLHSRQLPVVVSATYLKVHDESDEQTHLTSVILGSVITFLIIIIIALVLKIWKLTKYFHLQNPASDDLNYVALSFLPRTGRSRGPASKRETETDGTTGTAAQRGTEALSSTCICGWEGVTNTPTRF